MKAIITQGISASGKTTWAEEYVKDNPDFVNINRDDTRFELFTGGVRDWKLYKFTRGKEKLVTEHNENLIKLASEKGLNVVISDTNLNPKNLTTQEEFLTSLGYEVEYKVFEIEFEEALKRNFSRENGVNYEVLLNQYISFQRNVKVVKKYEPDTNKPFAYIVDIDGTVASKCDRNVFDYTRVYEDDVIVGVAEIVEALFYNGVEIIFLSGRDSDCIVETRQWLSDKLGEYTQDCKLLMRTGGDKRKDYIVKMELFDVYIRDHYNVLGSVDDRKQVIESCWSVLGVKTINVGNPWERF